jgi:16S rRNA (cytidine1402-2'-O)-methyltransferase
MSYHAHSDESRLDEIAELLRQGKNISVVTDAGTPGISDPGNELVKFIQGRLATEIEEGAVKIASVPGPSSLTTAISISGARASEFTFLGFLPHKKGRETIFKEIASNERTFVFFESTHRILKTLSSLKVHCPTKRVAVCRELSKIYEEVVAGLPEEVEKNFLDKPEKTKGEFVVIVSE